jgi:hypothetical protein
VKGDFSKYEICERWRDYGTDKFIPKVRPKDTRKLGFGSKSWKEKVENKKKKTSKSGNETINALSNKNVNGQQHYDLV